MSTKVEEHENSAPYCFNLPVVYSFEPFTFSWFIFNETVTLNSFMQKTDQKYRFH